MKKKLCPFLTQSHNITDIIQEVMVSETFLELEIHPSYL